MGVIKSLHTAPNFRARRLCVENMWEAETLRTTRSRVGVMSAGGGYARGGSVMTWRAYKVVTFCVDAGFISLSNFVHTSCHNHEEWGPRILGEDGSDVLG